MSTETLSVAFPKAQTSLLKTRKFLGEFERRLDQGDSNDLATLEGKVAVLINQLQREVTMLQTMVKNEPRTRRAVWSDRVDHFVHETGSLRQAFEVCLQRNRSARGELMRGISGMRRRPDHEEMRMREAEALERSKNNINMMIGMTKGLVKSAKTQGTMLKRVRTTALNVASNLGLSSSIVRLIQRREAQDRLLVYIGMIVTLLIIGLVYYLVRIM